MKQLDATTLYEDTNDLFLGAVFSLHGDGELHIVGYDVYEAFGKDPYQKTHPVWIEPEQVYALRDWLNKVPPDPNQPTNVIELFSGVQESLDNLSILGRKSA